MPKLIVPGFKKFATEGEIIGRLVMGYGSLENSLTSCIAMGIGNLDTAIKTLFQIRGETRRVNEADKLGLPAYRGLGFEPMFKEAIDDMRYCLQIRNQYAHGFWHEDLTGRLCFVNMEEIATDTAPITDLLGLTFNYIDVPLLIEQEDYFVYVADTFLFMNYEGRKMQRQFAAHAVPRPTKIARPHLYLPQRHVPAPMPGTNEKGAG
jgi:hypothetical protein